MIVGAAPRRTPRRRLFAAVALGVLALTGLAGCRQDPAVAAYVGDTRLAEAEVDRVMASVDDVIAPERRGDIRTNVVTMMVVREAGGRFIEAEQLSTTPADPASAAEQTGLAEDNAYVQLLAEFTAVLNSLEVRAPTVDPSEEDQREAYRNARIEGQPVEESFAEVQQFFTADRMGRAIGMRDMIRDVVERADVAVNPKYTIIYQVPVQIGQASSWLEVPISRGAAPVVDTGPGTDLR